MQNAATSLVLLATAFAAAQLPRAALAQAERAGRLEAGDKKLSEGQYYDDFPFVAAAGQSIKFMIKAKDFTPYAMLYSDQGELIEHTHGVYSSEGYALGTQWQVPKSGTWHLIVTASYPADADYTLSYEVVD